MLAALAIGFLLKNPLVGTWRNAWVFKPAAYELHVWTFWEDGNYRQGTIFKFYGRSYIMDSEIGSYSFDGNTLVCNPRRDYYVPSLAGDHGMFVQTPTHRSKIDFLSATKFRVPERHDLSGSPTKFVRVK